MRLAFALVLLLALLTACGRVGFDQSSGTRDGAAAERDGDVVEPDSGFGGSSISVAPRRLRYDRGDVQVDVTITDVVGAPLAGIDVVLSTDSGTTTIVQPPPTDAMGHTIGRVRSSAPGVVTIRAVATTPARTLTAPPVEFRGGPLLGFSFEEGMGSETRDSSPTGAVGFVGTTAWLPTGRYGGAVSFDGNDFVNIGYLYPPYFVSYTDHSDVTVELWARVTAVDGYGAMYQLGGCANSVALGHDDMGRAAASVMKDSEQTLVVAPTALLLNRWTHLAVVKSGTDVRLYEDGILVGTGTSGALWNTGNGVHGLGTSDAVESALRRLCSPTLVPEWFSGDIDELGVFDYALTPEMVRTEMEGPVVP